MGHLFFPARFLLTSTGAKNLVLKLILALQDLPAAWVLPSKNATGALLDDIVRFAPRVISGKFDMPQMIILLRKHLFKRIAVPLHSHHREA